MKGTLPKVLHRVAHLPMVLHVVSAARQAGSGEIAVVIGHGAESVKQALGDGIETYMQTERLGTAHAVLAARKAIERGFDDLLILFGDTPLVQPEALSLARQRLADGASIVVIGFQTDRPSGYGRLIEENGQLLAIREERDCSDEERKITFCNGGLMAVRGADALALLDQVDNKNSKGEYYLTDIVALAQAKGLKVVASEIGADNVIGVNNRAELAEVEAIWQQRKRREIMLEGVSIQSPETVFFSHDTQIGADCFIEPNVYFGPGVQVANSVTIHAFSHLEGARIETGAEIGPFARLRPGADLGEKSKVGNFCEVKNAKLGAGAKINHLTYIGDASIGAKANIGAGTITCNYDGFNKFKTEIGAGAFIGSNSSLIAPVSIGDGAYVASGSVISDNIPADALAFGRARQRTLEGRGKALRERLESQKAAASAKSASAKPD